MKKEEEEEEEEEGVRVIKLRRCKTFPVYLDTNQQKTFARQGGGAFSHGMVLLWQHQLLRSRFNLNCFCNPIKLKQQQQHGPQEPGLNPE
jgi:hypothetical protein